MEGREKWERTQCERWGGEANPFISWGAAGEAGDKNADFSNASLEGSIAI